MFRTGSTLEGELAGKDRTVDSEFGCTAVGVQAGSGIIVSSVVGTGVDVAGGVFVGDQPGVNICDCVGDIDVACKDQNLGEVGNAGVVAVTVGNIAGNSNVFGGIDNDGLVGEIGVYSLLP